MAFSDESGVRIGLRETGGMTTDEFIRDVKTDPYMALIQRMYADAWATGYQAARKDCEAQHHGAADMLRGASYSDLRNRAMREMFDQQQKAEAEMIVALAALGPLVMKREP